jgi:Xaa-Pro aminopeptidase
MQLNPFWVGVAVAVVLSLIFCLIFHKAGWRILFVIVSCVVGAAVYFILQGEVDEKRRALQKIDDTKKAEIKAQEDARKEKEYQEHVAKMTAEFDDFALKYYNQLITITDPEKIDELNKKYIKEDHSSFRHFTSDPEVKRFRNVISMSDNAFAKAMADIDSYMWAVDDGYYHHSNEQQMANIQRYLDRMKQYLVERQKLTA